MLPNQTGVSAKEAAKVAAQAGTITRHGIIGLSRVMTREDAQGGGWAQVRA